MKLNAKQIARGAVIAALYVALTWLANLLGLASGAVQLRLAEALAILPCFTFAAVPGLFVGCLLANLLTGCALWDVVFGSLATLLGALGTYFFGSKRRWAAPLFPIAANTAIVPFVLKYTYGLPGSVWYLALGVLVGEALSCGALGLLLGRGIDRTRLFERH